MIKYFLTDQKVCEGVIEHVNVAILCDELWLEEKFQSNYQIASILGNVYKYRL